MSLFGERNAEDKAAEKVRDAADWTADRVGEARDRANVEDHSLLETVKEKIGNAVEYTKECAHSAKETLLGETGSAPVPERNARVFSPRENTTQHTEIFQDIRDNNEDSSLPHAHDY
uniref:Uncharacterized protein n=1 Tax=Plectus sambesii TaxID=2011161 RepID=A0A914XP91_9BILA